MNQTYWLFTHTWVKAGGRWQIIGGTCGPTPARERSDCHYGR
jgi:hypothetical protein